MWHFGGRRDPPRSRPVTWLWVAASVAEVSAAVYGAVPLWTRSSVLAVTNGAVSVAFAATAVLLGSDRDQRGNGRLFLGASLLWTAGFIGPRGVGPLPLVQYVVGPTVFAPLATVLLRYPEPRLQRRTERIYVVLLAASVVTLRVFSSLISRPEWHAYRPSTWWPTIAALPGLDALATVLFTAAALLSALFFVILMIGRFRRSVGIDRRLVWPVVVSAIAVSLVVSSEVASHLLPDQQRFLDPVLSVEAAALLVVPTAFLIAAIRRRLSHAAVAGLVIRLSQPVTTDMVRTALRESLSDPDLEVAYWLPDLGAYFDTDGRWSKTPDRDSPRFTKYVTTSDGQPLARVTVDRSFQRYPRLVEAVVSAAGLALENGRLQAAMRAQLEYVRQSRARIAGAGDAERRRLERDLHDGVQQRLLALKLDLAATRIQAESRRERQLIDRTRTELQETLDELRILARGIHPAILTQSGLKAAVTSVAERLPMAVDVDIPPDRWDATAEATAYFVACEALSNAAKHSSARHAYVGASWRGRILDLEIVDDGDGGATVDVGGGLLGLQDRVAALGGHLTVISPLGSGTRIIASIPCE